jgi:hypothetical protein
MVPGPGCTLSWCVPHAGLPPTPLPPSPVCPVLGAVTEDTTQMGREHVQHKDARVAQDANDQCHGTEPLWSREQWW